MSLFFSRDIAEPRFHKSRIGQRGRAIAASAGILLLIACATTTTAQLDAFNALKTIRVSVVAAVTAFDAGYRANPPQFTEAQHTALGVLYNKYYAADQVAATALEATTTTDPTIIVQNVTALAGDVLKFVQALKPLPTTTPTGPAVTP